MWGSSAEMHAKPHREGSKAPPTTWSQIASPRSSESEQLQAPSGFGAIYSLRRGTESMWILLAVGAIAVLGIMSYNSLVKLRTQVEGAWADVDVQLKRRYDLIPNLVETVKGYASHEKETLEAVVQARSAAMGASTPGTKAQAEGMLAGALKSLFALSEAYPDLKAQAGFGDLQASLASIETSVARSRQYYNAVVRDFNTKIAQIPTNIVANAFRFDEREFFEVEDDVVREAPKVSFD